jgi:MFS family permease
LKVSASAYSLYVIAVLGGISLFNSLDQTLLPSVVASIQADLRLSDSQVGLLLGVGPAAVAVAALPVGYWTDRGSRRFIIGLGTAVWSVATLLTGMTVAFSQVLAARIVLGVGDASTVPAGTSLIGDYFSKRARGRAMAAVIGAGGLGIGGGFVLGGVVGLNFGWRAVFYFAAVPGHLLALAAFTIREPLRGSAESAGPKLTAVRDAGFKAFGRLLRVRTYAAVLAAGAFANFGYAVLSFASLYLHRRFGLDIAHAGAMVGGAMLLGVVVAVPAIGWILDRRGRRSPRAAAEVGLVGLVLSGAAAAVMFSAQSVGLFEVAMIVSAVVGGAGILAGTVVFQNVIAPSLRGSAVSMSVTSGRLCAALGPLAVGVISDSLHQNLGLSLLLLAPTATIAAAVSFGLAMANMKGDVEAMETAWAARFPVVPAPVAREIEYVAEYPAG